MEQKTLVFGFCYFLHLCLFDLKNFGRKGAFSVLSRMAQVKWLEALHMASRPLWLLVVPYGSPSGTLQGERISLVAVG
jgi:hypothetical protein